MSKELILSLSVAGAGSLILIGIASNIPALTTGFLVFSFLVAVYLLYSELYWLKKAPKRLWKYVLYLEVLILILAAMFLASSCNYTRTPVKILSNNQVITTPIPNYYNVNDTIILHYRNGGFKYEPLFTFSSLDTTIIYVHEKDVSVFPYYKAIILDRKRDKK